MSNGPASAQTPLRPFPLMRILVVEDEFLIRMMLCEILNEQGYEVSEAATADEALALISPLTPDLIVTDVQMPGTIDGLEMLAVVRVQYPMLPVVIMSGHLNNWDVNLDDCTYFRQKPVAFDEFVELIKKAIGPSLTADAPISDVRT